MLNLTPAVVSQLVYLGIAAVVVCIIALFWNKRIKRLDKSGIKPSRAELVGVYIFWMSIFPSFTEEVLFRGPLLALFSKLNGWAWLAIFSQAIFFGLIHFNTYKIFQGTALPMGQKNLMIKNALMGILFGWLTIKTQTLWLPIIVHAVSNLTLGLFGIIIILLFAAGFLLSILATGIGKVKKLWRRGYN